MWPQARRSPRTYRRGRSASRADVNPSSTAGSSDGSRLPRTKTPLLERTRGNPRIDHMCGIIGYIGSKPVVPVLIDGLRRMEYRGYDSAGVALVSPEGISLRRSAGKLVNLENVI